MTDLPICERYINMHTISFILMGQAIRKIRDGRFYERDWKGHNFESYCRQRYNLTRRQVDNIIKASAAALVWIKHKGDSEVLKLPQTVWGMMGRFLLNESELVETAGELMQRYEQGISPSKTKEFLEQKGDAKAIEESEKMGQERKKKARQKQPEQPEPVVETPPSPVSKDDHMLPLDQECIQDVREDWRLTWKSFMSRHGGHFPSHMLMEVAMADLVKSHEEQTAKMKPFQEA